jgi:exopolysaccharide biosynthesis polyprenyl glycosylphosphotransferase
VSPLINDCRHLGIMVNITLDISELISPKTEIDKIGSFNIVSFQSYDYSPVQRFIKALMDLAGGFIGIIIFAIAYLFIAPLIKITSPGPVLFTQTRKGKNGREFKLYKFRTMYADAEERKKEFLSRNEMKGHIFKLRDDPRVTPLGKFLRFTSLDELPQFINILKGNMSLVGTRPPTVEEFDAYEKRHRRRLSIRPGLTGLWQVSGRNEISDFEDIVKLDTKYIDTWSIWLDIKIILKTSIVLFKGR